MAVGPGVEYVAPAVNDPRPSPSRILTRCADPSSTTARSGRRSPLKSAATTAAASVPAGTSTGARKVTEGRAGGAVVVVVVGPVLVVVVEDGPVVVVAPLPAVGFVVVVAGAVLLVVETDPDAVVEAVAGSDVDPSPGAGSMPASVAGVPPADTLTPWFEPERALATRPTVAPAASATGHNANTRICLLLSVPIRSGIGSRVRRPEARRGLFRNPDSHLATQERQNADR